jgi:DNA invertase Pin-like site-specific DNA recombinase
MIADARAGRFDFLITKEISRFSRSTLDSIRYTQELLARGVGVLFQTTTSIHLDPDSEFRLVVMAGVAQDEVRKLSERLKFGFRQSIKTRVLGNGAIWGYDKRNGRLTVNEAEAEAVRLIFGLYADQKLGFRRFRRNSPRAGISAGAARRLTP